MDTGQWHQEFGVVMKPMEELASSSNGIIRTLRSPQKQQQQQQQGPLQCPRCKSCNTKFCYYNNYSLTQPRYFCKACRRYWTEGGSLRNVPVGGGSRKNKGRSANSTSTSATSTQNPKFHEGGQDLNLAFPLNHFAHHMDKPNNSSSNCTSTSMELLRSPFVLQIQSMPMMPEYPSGFSSVQQGYRSNTLTSPSDGGYAIRMQQGVQESSTSSGRLMFPFENSRDQFTDHSNDDEQNRRQEEGEAHGFWNGMI